MEWRQIPGYESYLEVNEFGEVRSVERYVNHRNGSLKLVRSKILTPYPDPKGYLKIRTSVNKEKTCIKVHRAVAEAFIPNPDNKPQIDHIDGDKTNNCVENLRWVTNRENYDYSAQNGLRTKSFEALKDSQKNPEVRAKASRKTVERCSKKTYCFSLDGEFIAEYSSGTEAGRAVGGCQSGVSGCCTGKYPTYKNFIFSYDRNRFGVQSS